MRSMNETSAAQTDSCPALRPVTVLDMAQAREHRASVQRAMLTKSGQVLVSFMLNIPGPVKTGALYDTAFDEGVRRIRAAVADIGAVCKTEISSRLFTGSEYYALLKADAYEVKRALCKAEEEDALGRLFDIDVLYLPAETTAGATASAGAGVPVKIGRSDIGLRERRCLLCDNDAHACARARTHTVTEIVSAIQDIIRGWIAQNGTAASGEPAAAGAV